MFLKSLLLGNPQREVFDFRKVNEVQQEVLAEGKKRGQISLHPLPKIDEMYAKLKGAKVFSTIDLRSRYYHIALGKDSRAKTAFLTPFDKYKFLMISFGLAQVPAYFQLLMNQVLEDARSFCSHLGGVFCLLVIGSFYFFCNCARGLYYSGYTLMSCDFWGM